MDWAFVESHWLVSDEYRLFGHRNIAASRMSIELATTLSALELRE
jgi:hypothetical protein